MITELFYFFEKSSGAIQAVSGIVLACTAIFGIREWKKQVKGKTDYEVARRYLKATLKLRDSMRFVRHPFISVGEMQSSLKDQELNPDDYIDNKKTNLAVYSVRWKKVQEAWTDLEAEILEAEVSWGKEAVNVSKNLIDQIKELMIAIQLYLDGEHKPIREHIIYDLGTIDKPDQFSIKVNDSIEKIKSFLKPHLF